MEISFIHMQILVHLHVNKTNFHMKGFALGLALKQLEAKGNSEIAYCLGRFASINFFVAGEGEGDLIAG